MEVSVENTSSFPLDLLKIWTMVSLEQLRIAVIFTPCHLQTHDWGLAIVTWSTCRKKFHSVQPHANREVLCVCVTRVFTHGSHLQL
jgi:hypothetical protein